jgi:hypothetical protein
VLQIKEFAVARKRAPGGGRKSAGEFSDLSDTLSIRMPADMRAQLVASAGRRPGGGWSLTQELLHRVQRTFDRERDARRDPAARALCYLLAEVITSVAFNVRPRDWRSDRFAFQTVRLAFNYLLDTLEPPGEIRAPDRTDKGNPFAALGQLWAVPGDHRFEITQHQTPEDMARFISHVLLSRLAEETVEPAGEWIATRTIPHSEQETEFGMGAARRHLAIRKGE